MKKLVRDNIPTLFDLQTTHIADDKEYYQALINKLHEEVDEYKESQEIEELADIIEVIHALSEYHNTPIEQLETVRKQKAQKRGRFEKRIIWHKE